MSVRDGLPRNCNEDRASTESFMKMGNFFLSSKCLHLYTLQLDTILFKIQTLLCTSHFEVGTVPLSGRKKMTGKMLQVTDAFKSCFFLC